MKSVRINLYSDTQTQPAPGMRHAMAEADVGDEQHQLDPSVNRLCEEVAKRLRKDRAIFLPSGTMCNQIALAVHCAAGDEIIADKTAHIVNNEAAGSAVFAGAAIRALNGERGIFRPTDVEASLRSGRPLEPRSRLVVIEQTSNGGGGSIWPLETLDGVSEVARDHGLALHMDGARLLNAVVASGTQACDFTNSVDSVWLDLTKGLGCPVGAVLAGSDEFIREAWRWKHRLGGAMRQAGILAAAGSWALTHHVDRLAEDHDNARSFAQKIESIEGVTILNPEVETNLVFFDIAKTGWLSRDVAARLRESGVWIGENGPTRMRAVTHLGVDRPAVDEAAELFSELLTR
jgi:threonine aldolase